MAVGFDAEGGVGKLLRASVSSKKELPSCAKKSSRESPPFSGLRGAQRDALMRSRNRAPMPLIDTLTKRMPSWSARSRPRKKRAEPRCFEETILDWERRRANWTTGAL